MQFVSGCLVLVLGIQCGGFWLQGVRTLGLRLQGLKFVFFDLGSRALPGISKSGSLKTRGM